MMKLNETNQFIKDNLQNIIDGKFYDKFSPEQIEMMIQCSFLYNHTTFESDSIIFKYNAVTFKLSGTGSETFSSTINDMIQSTHPMSEDDIFSIIRNDKIFKSAYRNFMRDIRIETILK